MKTKKILIVTYYWTPAGGPGVQRWLKFVKYLSQLDYDITVYTVSNGEYPIIDNTLESDIPKEVNIIKAPIWEPFSFYKKVIGQKKEEKINPGFLHENKKQSLAQSLSVWIRGNFFIPDARVFWIKPSVKKLTTLIKENNFDSLITTGPPHTAHIIGLKLKQKFDKLPWIADFRDPWTSIDFFKDLKLSKFALKKHHKQEKEVLNNASHVLVVGNGMKEEFSQKTTTPITVIPNGYDPEDYQHSIIPAIKRFSIAHIGMINKDRNHKIFYSALADLCSTNPEFKKDLVITFAGKLDASVQESLKKYDLEKNFEYTPYIPHKEVFEYQRQSALLYLPINNSPNAKAILTGKLFEYLAAERPILSIGPSDGDAASIINSCKAGKVIDFKDEKSLKETITFYYEQFKLGKLTLNEKLYTTYSRKELTNSVDSIIKEYTND